MEYRTALLPMARGEKSCRLIQEIPFLLKPFVIFVQPFNLASQLTDLLSQAHCVFVNSVHVYDDKIIVLFNYKDGEKCIRLDELGDKENKPNTQNKCSALIKSGDPSGNRTRDTLIKSQVLYRLS